MAIGSGSYHEDAQKLTTRTQHMHRALVSLQEELEAVDWYRQRADACEDEALKAILLHNMREEIEHACMILEWVRRNDGDFDRQMKTYLFTEAPVTEVEEVTEGTASEEARAPAETTATSGPGPQYRFTVGSLKG